MFRRKAVLLSLLWTGIVWAQSSDVRPHAEEQAALLASAGRYAEKYMNSLPNFICMRVNQQYESNKKGEKWKQGDTLTSRLEWRDGREKRTLQLVNNKPLTEVSHRWHTPLTTEGEFGSMLQGIFADSSNAQFNWDRWEQIQNKRAARFTYTVDKAHSVLKMGDTLVGTFVVPYHGFFSIEEGTGIVLEVNVSADDLPSQLQSREISTTIAYADTSIGTDRYILPTHATVVLHTDRNVIRNEMAFEQYRKFGAESSLSFGSSDDNSAPAGGPPAAPSQGPR